jgi:ketosteroid isomerase-like protein
MKACVEVAMNEHNKQVVLAFIDAMGRGDAAAAAPCIAEDTFTLAKGFGQFAGVRTHDTILATIDAFRQLMPGGMEPTILSVTGEDNRVVVEFEGNGTLFNGETYNNQYCMVFMLRDGRIRQVNEYFCTLLADKVLWPLVSAMTL